MTGSQSTVRWFDPWERAGDDKKIRIQMAFEEGKATNQAMATVAIGQEPSRATPR